MIKFLTLKQVCEKIVDCQHETPNWLENGIPVIRNFNLIDGRIDFSKGYYVDEDTYIKRTKREIPREGDIVFSREAPIGKCAIIPKNFKCCLGQRIVLLRPNKKICSSEYLLTVLLSDYVRKQIEQVSKRGSIVSNFNIGDLGDLRIPVLDNQENIADFSAKIMNKIILNHKINTELEAMAKTIYDYWFLQYEFPNEEGKPYKSNGGKMIYNEMLKREIPENWQVKNIMSFIKWEGTSQPPKACFIYEPKEGYIRFIQNRDYEDNSHLTFIPKNKALGICDKYDILIDKYGDAGKTRFGLEGAYNVALAKINVKNELYKEYIRNVLSSDAVYTYLHNSSMASTRASLNENNISYINIVVPNNETLTKFNKLANNYIETTLKLKAENEELTRLRDELLPLLMNGQVSFKN